MEPLAIIGIFTGAGATLKLADHLGENSQGITAYVSAILSGILFGVLMHIGPEESSYVFGIVIGVALSGKINRPNLIVGLLTVGVVVLPLGLSTPYLWLVFTVSILSLVDEVGHSYFSNKRSYMSVLFRYRASLKVGTIFLSVATLISLTTTLGFLCFDLSYDLTSHFIE
jgi:heme exporter protein D